MPLSPLQHHWSTRAKRHSVRAACLPRAISFIEDYIREQILPLYGNTHTTTSRTGLQSTRLREEARHIIHRCVNGSPDDVVIFAGSGFTGAQIALLRTLGFDMKGRDVSWQPLPLFV